MTSRLEVLEKHKKREEQGVLVAARLRYCEWEEGEKIIPEPSWSPILFTCMVEEEVRKLHPTIDRVLLCGCGKGASRVRLFT